ncbi:MAG: C4-type zinc ribbon domain-containing protein [Gemmatimonadota bacterium]
MQELHAALLALQDIDDEIAGAQARFDAFAPRLSVLEKPVAAVERELALTSTRLAEMRTEHSRLQVNAQQKEERLQTYHERLEKARTAREESALRAELDLVRGALEADRTDLRHLGDQTTRTDLKVDDLTRQLEKAKEAIEEERATLLEERAAVETELALLQQKRENHAVRLDQQSRRLYERVRGQRSRRVVAPMTDEGACGNCFNILPLQEQTEVRRGATLHRCEGCGVILYAT